MATLAAMVSGNFTAAATWKTIISEVDSEIGTYAVLTSYRTSTGFVASGESCSGIGIKLASATSANAGITFTAELYNVTDGTIAATVTVKKINMVCETTLTTTPTWVFFSFSPVTMTSGKIYSVRCIESTASSVTLYGNGSSISYLMISDTTASPGSGDKLLISGNLTGSDTGNDVEVTMDNTAATSFGGIMIGRRGTLRYSTIPGSLYKLTIGGNAMGATTGSRGIEIANSGLLEIGSLLSGMPASATGQLQLNCGTAVAFGIEARQHGRIVTYGSPKLPYTRLSATASGTATTLQVASNSGWQIGDTIGIAANRRVANQHEINVITGLIGATGIILASGLTNDHDGGFNAQGDEVGAHIGNLTENVQIFGGTIALTTYINSNIRSEISFYNTEMYWLGSGTVNKRGIDIASSTTLNASFIISGCSIHDCTVASSRVFNVSSGSIGVVINNCFVYNFVAGVVVGGFAVSPYVSIDSVAFVGCVTSATVISLSENRANITNCVVSGGSNGIAYSTTTEMGTCSGNIIYNMSTSGISIGAAIRGIISSCVIFRQAGTSGGFTTTASPVNVSPVIIDSCKVFGNKTSNILISSSITWYLKNCVVYSEGGFTTASGFTFASNTRPVVEAENCSFIGHTTADINFNQSNTRGSFKLSNCVLGSATNVASIANSYCNSIISSQNDSGVIGVHKTYKYYGTLDTDTVRYSTGPASLKLTPTSSTYKLTSEGFNGNPSVLVGQGNSVTATVKVRMSLLASGDSGSYNGAFPRLMNKRNYGLGILTDTVLATATAGASGSFLAISGTTSAASATGVLEFFVDCDGTAGSVSIDDWSFYQN